MPSPAHASHDAAEAAHWPALQAVAIDYLRRRTSNFTKLPLSDRDAKLAEWRAGMAQMAAMPQGRAPRCIG